VVDSDPFTRGDGQYWYAVQIRSHAAPVTGNLGVKIGGTKLRSVEFEVTVDETEVAQSSTSALAIAERHRAAREGIGAVAVEQRYNQRMDQLPARKERTANETESP